MTTEVTSLAWPVASATESEEAVFCDWFRLEMALVRA